MITGFGMNFGGVRSRLFFHSGPAWLEGEDHQFSAGGRLVDGRASYGAGFTAWFLGIPWNVDMARPTDMKTTLDKMRWTFYIGPASF